jgi:hypothetical protein
MAGAMAVTNGCYHRWTLVVASYILFFFLTVPGYVFFARRVRYTIGVYDNINGFHLTSD